VITDEGRRFYSDSFHFGYYRTARESLAEAVDAHTDLVAEMARLQPRQRVLDVGCGIGAPALRIARRYKCEIIAVNSSREQVRQGNRLIAEQRSNAGVRIVRGDARALDFPDGSFDAVVCLEAAGDICITERDKRRLVRELHRVLRPGGHVGFSDLALHSLPPAAEERALRAVLYHTAVELITDWPALFVSEGFTIVQQQDIIAAAIPTWTHTRSVYEERHAEVVQRYGRRIAARTREQVEMIQRTLTDHGTFPLLSARKDGMAILPQAGPTAAC
jgi:cyclopropane fatty-acyl-phospholipid synthase-like methyltransferase